MATVWREKKKARNVLVRKIQVIGLQCALMILMIQAAHAEHSGNHRIASILLRRKSSRA
jgi:hypothetical protein